MSLPRVDQSHFKRIFLRDLPLLDVRAEIEFAKGAFPMAHNLPLLTTEERAAVGTIYKTRGQKAAIALGHEYLSGATREQRIESWKSFVRENPTGLLYCFRGGLRSQSVQEVLFSEGVEIKLIEGGYKALRSYLMQVLDESPQKLNLQVLTGYTGSRKTKLLHGKKNFVDLEHLAQHRGSSFGHLKSSQPNPINFENALAITLLKTEEKANASLQTKIWIEDESRMIGHREIPAELFKQMQNAELYFVEVTIEERIQNLLEDYLYESSGIDRLNPLTPEQAEALRSDFTRSLKAISKRLGGFASKTLIEQMESAIAQHQRHAGFEHHEGWVRDLLNLYYDPIYARHIEANKSRLVWRGPTAEFNKI